MIIIRLTSLRAKILAVGIKLQLLQVRKPKYSLFKYWLISILKMFSRINDMERCYDRISTITEQKAMLVSKGWK